MRCNVRLDGEAFSVCSVSGSDFETQLDRGEIVGCSCNADFSPFAQGLADIDDLDIASSTAALFNVIAYAPKYKARRGRRGSLVKIKRIIRMSLTFIVDLHKTAAANNDLARLWQRHLSPVLRSRIGIGENDQISGSDPRLSNGSDGERASLAPSFPRVVVIINPVGGTRLAKKLFKKWAAPVFRDAGIEFAVEITKKRGFARKLAEEMDLTSVDAIVTCSGDGVVHEV